MEYQQRLGGLLKFYGAPHEFFYDLYVANVVPAVDEYHIRELALGHLLRAGRRKAIAAEQSMSSQDPQIAWQRYGM